MPSPLHFSPIYKTRVWGGNHLKKIYQRPIDSKNLYGESWEICDRKNEQSIVSGGKWKGKTLNELWNQQRKEIFGERYQSLPSRFPLLLKILDARENLSIQVHPPAGKTPPEDPLPKDEFWYISKAEKEAKIYAGFREEFSRQQINQAIQLKSISSLLKTFPALADNFLEIPAGTIHAIGKGITIFEIQVNSDTTYRLYDWDRDNNRSLHIQEGIESLHLLKEVNIGKAKKNSLLTQMSFQVKYHTAFSGKIKPSEPEEFCLYMLIEGICSDENQHTWKSGDTLLIPRNSSALEVQTPLRFLEITWQAPSP